MADHRSPEEIERDIERERAELSSTLETLTDKFSVDRMVRTSQDYVTEHGGELAANFARTVKETPTAAVLTAVGIGWMILGNQRQRGVEHRDRSSGRDYARADYGRSDYGRSDYDPGEYAGGSAQDSYDRPEYRATSASAYDATGYGSSASSGSYGTSAGTGPAPAPSASSYGAAMGSEGGGDFDDRVAAADARMRVQATGTAGIVDDDLARYETYDAERDQVSRDYGAGRSEDETSMLERISDHAQDIWHQTVDAVRGGYRSAYRSATELRNSLFEGTERMDVRGRERVASARARAYEAQLRGKDYARRGQQQANDFFYEQPLVAGALAMALGAVVGGLLPRTRREDEAFGSYRDQLFEDAEAVFHDERMRAEAAARAALAEAGTIAEEAKDSVLGRTPDGREAVDAAEDKARTAAQRVASAAREAHDSGSASRGADTPGGSPAGTV